MAVLTVPVRAWISYIHVETLSEVRRIYRLDNRGRATRLSGSTWRIRNRGLRASSAAVVVPVRGRIKADAIPKLGGHPERSAKKAAKKVFHVVIRLSPDRKTSSIPCGPEGLSGVFQRPKHRFYDICNMSRQGYICCMQVSCYWASVPEWIRVPLFCRRRAPHADASSCCCCDCYCRCFVLFRSWVRASELFQMTVSREAGTLL